MAHFQKLKHIRLPTVPGSEKELYSIIIEGKVIKDIRISDSCRNDSSGNFTEIDCEGAYGYPGFTDAHVHLVGYSQSLDYVMLENLRFQDALDAIRLKSGNLAQGSWLRGRGWEINKWESGKFPDKFQLDQVCPEHPAVLISKDGHAVWLNSAAIQRLGFDTFAEDPPGGRFLRLDNSLEISGVLLENAAEIAIRRLPGIPQSVQLENLKKAAHVLYSKGIVAAHCFEQRDALFLLNRLTESEPLHIRFYWSGAEPDPTLEPGLKSNDMYGNIQIGGIKLFADGALGSRTAAVSVPYDNDPKAFGEIVTQPDEMAEKCARAAACGIETAIHAIGDRAVENAVSAMHYAFKRVPDAPPCRIEHAQLVSRSDMKRFAELGIFASIQPTHLLSDIYMVEKLWKNQTALRYPYKSFFDSGIPLLFGSDAPIELPDPLLTIQAALTRRRIDGYPDDGFCPDEKLSLEAALHACTVSPTILERRENIRGKLAPGYWADLVVLDQALHKVPATQIKNIKVRMTLVGGQVVYSE